MSDHLKATNEPRAVAWITGAAGLIGSYIVRTAEEWAPRFKIVALARQDLDVTDFQAVRDRFRRENPALVIHCAAVTKTTACEEDPKLAKKLNVDATELLAGLAAEIPFVFFSTDLVFDGKKGCYREDDPVNPLAVYAETKAAAEQIVLPNPKHTVIRTSLNGGTSPSGNRGFNEELRRVWTAGQPSRLFVDEFRSPVAAVETARAVWELVAKRATGLYHIAGTERLSRWQIGQLIAARWPQLHPNLEPASLRDYNGPPRSPDTSLNCAKAEAVVGRRLPALTEWLDRHATEPF